MSAWKKKDSTVSGEDIRIVCIRERSTGGRLATTRGRG